MRFGRGGLIFGGCGCFVVALIFMFFASIMASGGIGEILEEIFYMLR